MSRVRPIVELRSLGLVPPERSDGHSIDHVERKLGITVTCRGELPGGEQSAIATCLDHETAVNGGFAVDGDAVPTRSMFVGSNSRYARAR